MSHRPFILPARAAAAVAVLLLLVGCRSLGDRETFAGYPLIDAQDPYRNAAPNASGPYLRPVPGTSEGAPHNYFPVARAGELDPVTGLPPRPSQPDVSAEAFWPLDRYYQLDRADTATRVNALGEIFHFSQEPITGREEFGFRPLFYWMNDPAAGTAQFDFLWPLGHYRKEPGYERMWVMPIVWYNRFRHADGREDLDAFVLPVFFFGEETFPADLTAVDRLYWRDRNHDGDLSREELQGLDEIEFERIDEDGDGLISRNEAVDALALPPRTESYFAAVPFGGTLRGFLLNDWLEFYLFPLFLHTRQGEFESWYAPWPIVHWGHGGGRNSFHIIPFYAEDVQRELVRNEAGELVPGPVRREAYSVLWPIIQWQNIYGDVNVSDDPRQPRFERRNIFHSEMVFPFWQQLRTPNKTTTTVLWPFFSVQEDRSRNYVAIDAPWPIFRTASGIGEHELRIWPLFHEYRYVSPGGDEDYLLNLLWPIIWFERQRRHGSVETSFKVIPLFWHTTLENLDPASGEVVSWAQSTKIWPFAGYQRFPDGTERFEFLSPLPEATVRDFENNWAVFYRLFYWERSGDGKRLKWNALGPLIRYEKDETGEAFDFFPLIQHRSGWTKGPYPLKQWSTDFLYGLVGTGADEIGRYLRLLWFIKIRLDESNRRLVEEHQIPDPAADRR